MNNNSNTSLVLATNGDYLKNLAHSVYHSKALNNRFYDLWMSKPLTLQQVVIFARNYGEFTYRFPDILCFIISQMKDIDAKIEYVRTLYSEMGYGNTNKVHSALFFDLIGSLTEKLGSRLSRQKIVDSHPLLESTQRYLDELKTLYAIDPAVAAGAQLAQEWQAYTMIRQLYEGTRQYIDLWPTRDEFHEDCEFFYAHIGETEKAHKEEALRGAMTFATDTNSLRKIEQGFNTLLEEYVLFWDGIADAIENC